MRVSGARRGAPCGGRIARGRALQRSHYIVQRAGRVIDFFATTFIDFAVFNVADCFVCIGGALWVLAVLLAERKNKKGQANGGA